LENLVIDYSFWKNKKVFVTGHTGFKGSWLSIWLKHLGAEVVGISLEPPSTPNLYSKANVSFGMVSLREDIRNLEPIKKLFQKHKPEIVFHLAAQPLVRQSYLDPVETYETNVMGTLNILEGIRSIDSVSAAIMVTSDKCYQSFDSTNGYSENDPMGGYDPYSSSKGAAELLIASYRNSYFPKNQFQKHQVSIASVRAGNVIGGGDWAKDRLIPDILQCFQESIPLKIRYPNAIRPWQHVLEPLAGYLKLAEHLGNFENNFAEAWNFGPIDDDVKPVKWIVDKISDFWDGEAKWIYDDNVHPHEESYLKLNCDKAFNKLNWEPKWSLETTLIKIIEWHQLEQNGSSCIDACLKQINEYVDH
jgi:CDP-glucose 4,6-dehydratase